MNNCKLLPVKGGLCSHLWGATAQALTEEELVQVLAEPRNALAKQFTYQFKLSDTRLHLTSGAQVH